MSVAAAPAGPAAGAGPLDHPAARVLIRRHRLRWWTRNQLEELLLESGAARVRLSGDNDEFVAIAEAP